MAHVAFRQADLERVFRAAAKSGSIVQMDMKTLIITVIPPGTEKLFDEYGNELGAHPLIDSVRRGVEHWDDD